MEISLTLEECFSTLTKVKLIDIARTKGIRGYSNLGKDALIELLLENIYPNEESLKETLDQYTNSTLELLKIITEDKGKKEYFEAKNEFGEIYKASSTFYKALHQLQADALLFDVTEDDSDYIGVPFEVQAVIRPLLGVTTGKEEITPEEDEELVKEELEEPMELNNFEELIVSFVPRDAIVELCEENKIETHRKRVKTLITSLITDKISPEEIMDSFFTVSPLRDISKDLGLPVSRNKAELIKAIIEKLPPTVEKVVEPKREIVEEVSTEEAAVLASSAPEVISKKVVQESIEFEKSPKEITREKIRILRNAISHLILPMLTKSDRERQIESAAISLMNQAIELKEIKGRIGVRTETITHFGKRYTPDAIFYDKDTELKAAIEIKNVGRASDLERLAAQINAYKDNYPFVLAFAYDTRKTPGTEITKEEIKRNEERDIFVAFKRHGS
ncbi:MAG: hypothetical protein ACXADY_02780 [Candidatus Hodarchaeales archaeon]